jgi:hypothetical protein
VKVRLGPRIVSVWVASRATDQRLHDSSSVCSRINSPPPILSNAIFASALCETSSLASPYPSPRLVSCGCRMVRRLITNCSPGFEPPRLFAASWVAHISTSPYDSRRSCIVLCVRTLSSRPSVTIMPCAGELATAWSSAPPCSADVEGRWPGIVRSTADKSE